MEWLTVVIAGVTAGAFSSLVAPVGQTMVEKARARGTHRRDMLSNGRMLVSDARRRGWSDTEVQDDWRFIALRAHLEGVVANSRTGHAELLDRIDELETEWKLT